MQTLTVEDFIKHLGAVSSHDLLSPAEASLLQLKIAELLLDYSVDVSLLKFLSRFLTPQLYDELVEEKNIEHQCGYLVCGQLPKRQVRRASSVDGAHEMATKFRIYNRKPSIILPNTYSSQYCCKDHYQASLFYRNQLSLESLISRKGIMEVPPFAETAGVWYENNITCLEEVLAKHRELKEQGKTLGDVIAMMNGLSVADGDNETTELVKLIEDFEIIENHNPEFIAPGFGLEDEETESAAKGVEGYITNDRCYGGYVV
ncbi:hypothetical protein METBIDRAFT_32214 [Metschnikowia bicuspidata var. bicuspidata NRRL YB-4993]|uniref:RNA polymerase II subunit B1 CTD phosphatase RPAP2 homolog n=1 Tax=Metschnikowia bicuspidata var. bicuspidata NRRL YB-4993 TaxID=869754 RepID=A0A1A0HCV2_9ASCO|nr:hypothetical protein METBIDRAFT_32214 [Metschnikowia bicuspidata var. bicuspidata NRRL YB-4993]OBA21753.1 hypothetical protein METBIDRAFT_32214 [Metschnikowia bicuspidata var. bicuspidata NRRL YB-4993]